MKLVCYSLEVNMDHKIVPKYSEPKIREKKVTHLYFNDKYLKRIPKLAHEQNFVVMYLHSNEIHEITNLDRAHNVTSLYLQNNRILKIANLDSLKKLKKLYLGHNIISVVEGLQHLQSLEELYLEKQLLYEGNCLCFDPRTTLALSQSLQVLNVSHNKIQTLSSLKPLQLLRKLNASHNELNDINEISDIIKDWFYLKDLNLADNPICKNRLYRESIVANAYCLGSLDEREINEQTRNFLKRLHRERIAQRLYPSANLANKIPGLPKNYSSAIQKAVSISVLKHQEPDIFDERDGVYLPWKTLPKPQNRPKLRQLRKRKKQPNQIPSSFTEMQI